MPWTADRHCRCKDQMIQTEPIHWMDLASVSSNSLRFIPSKLSQWIQWQMYLQQMMITMDEKLNNGLKVTTYRTIILILDHVFDKCIILHFSEVTAYWRKTYWRKTRSIPSDDLVEDDLTVTVDISRIICVRAWMRVIQRNSSDCERQWRPVAARVLDELATHLNWLHTWPTNVRRSLFMSVVSRRRSSKD